MVQSLLADAAEFYGQGKEAEAYDALDEAQRFDPGNPGIHQARAELFFRERGFTHALEENRKAMAVEKTDVRCFLHGQCLLALGRYESAKDMAELGLELSDCARGHHLLARCMEALGLNRQALAEYNRAAELARNRENNPTQVVEIETDRNQMLFKHGGALPEAG